MTTDSTKGTRYDGSLSGDLENEVTILSGSKGNTSGATHGGSKGAPSSGGKGSSSSPSSGNGGNWPSTTGQPSGGGRGNNAPKR